MSTTTTAPTAHARRQAQPVAAEPGIDIAALERSLRRTVRGEVHFDAGHRALYATDASNYRQVPIGVVLPRDADDAAAAVAACRAHGAPLLPRGAGTSLCGQCCNVAVVLDFSKYMNRVLEIDAAAGWARVQPGVVLDELRAQAGRQGLTFAPDPATHNHNTLGGMLGNNSCGPHSVMGGETVHNVLELEVLTYDGLRLRLRSGDADAYAALHARGGRAAQIARDLKALTERWGDEIRRRFPRIPRRVSGYNLPWLLPENGFDLPRALVGSEGTCAVVLEARVRLLPNPPARALLLLGYPSVYEAGDHVPEVMRARPVALEGVDQGLIDDMRLSHLREAYTELLPEGGGWLLVEFGGRDDAEAQAHARRLMQQLAQADAPPSMKLLTDPEQQHHVWKVRESGLGATAHVPGEPLTWEGWEDSSVPPERLGDYLRELRALFERYDYRCDLYGHFGQGCVHTRIDFDLETRPGIDKYRRFVRDAAELVVRMGGSISGEHGDGQSKAELLPLMFGPELVRAFEAFKAIWDPAGKMNPGKIVRPFRADHNLRLGTSYRPAPVETVMHFAADGGNFAHAMLRCVGVGECRKREGTMCPSYMATMDEMHSTRGRAHLLFEMLNAERDEGVLKQPWREPAVKQALDLCLSCKACKHECPVHVDMAAYKAEFLSHYHRHHRRPLAAHAFGHIDRWARWAGWAPGLVNAALAQPGLAAVARRLLHVAPQRALPQFARRTFRQQFVPGDAPAPRGEVLLWPDTFNNHFEPAVALAAAEVLGAAGFDVRLPPAGMCCGRPLYEFGLLDAARGALARILRALDGALRAGTPIVVFEPAFLSVFKHELPMMLPKDEQALRLQRQSVLFSDFLHERVPDLPLHPLDADAVVHRHCHHKTVLGSDADDAWLERLGLRCRRPDSGCCGMAGSFGYEAHKYEVSMRCAERVLLPAVREAGPDALVIADGYSCREQIAHGSGRPARHLAQVMAQAMRGTAPPR